MTCASPSPSNGAPPFPSSRPSRPETSGEPLPRVWRAACSQLCCFGGACLTARWFDPPAPNDFRPEKSIEPRRADCSAHLPQRAHDAFFLLPPPLSLSAALLALPEFSALSPPRCLLCWSPVKVTGAKRRPPRYAPQWQPPLAPRHAGCQTPPPMAFTPLPPPDEDTAG